MKKLVITYDNEWRSVDQSRYEWQQRCIAELCRIKQLLATTDRYSTPYAFMQLPDDHSMLQELLAVAAMKKKLRPHLLIVIGIGGSNLGTCAVQQFLLGRLYNEISTSLPVYYVDGVGTDYTQQIFQLAQRCLQEGQEILLYAATKSGTTTETMAHFSLFVSLLKKERSAHYADYIVVTSDQGSALSLFAKEQGWTIFQVPPALGGRYSVGSAVALFPLALLDIDLSAYLQGMRIMRDQCMAMKDNPAIDLALWQFFLLQQGIMIQNMFVFAHDLMGFGAWWRQLYAESLGKVRKQQDDKRLLPIVSLGSVDLHSIGQLYLSASIPIATTFVTTKMNASLTVPDEIMVQRLMPYIAHKGIEQIDQAIVLGVQRAYQKKKLPFVHVHIPEKSPAMMGQLLQLYMHQVVFIAHLLGINSFDQPEVEYYKAETRSILANE